MGVPSPGEMDRIFNALVGLVIVALLAVLGLGILIGYMLF